MRVRMRKRTKRGRRVSVGGTSNDHDEAGLETVNDVDGHLPDLGDFLARNPKLELLVIPRKTLEIEVRG